MAADLRLHRFLISTKWDAAAAADAYVTALGWRRDKKMDALRDRIVRSNPSFFVGGACGGDAPAVLDVLYVGEHDAATQQVQPRTFTREGSDGRHNLLLDRLGNLVVIECPGLVDNAGIFALGTAKWTESFLAGTELTVLMLDELSRRQGRLALTCKILDMQGMKLLKAFMSKEEKEGERAFKDAGSQVSAAYPTTTFKMLLLNLPGASMAGPIIKSMAPARSAKKFEILSSKTALTQIQTYVEPANLPHKLGGELPDGVQWGTGGKKSPRR